MKRSLLVAASCLVVAISVPAMAADVGVSVTVGQPGFYGHIDIGDFPAPAVIYSQPVMIQPVPMAGPPLYLRVPPGHYKHWNKHCAEYNACGRPVYFVRDNWYNNVYVPHYREKHGHEGGGDHGRGEMRGRDDGDHHDRGHGKDRDHGRSRDD